MNIPELMELCKKNKTLTLVFPSRKARGNRARLFGKSGPFGEVVCESQSGLVLRFRSSDILTYLNKQELSPQ